MKNTSFKTSLEFLQNVMKRERSYRENDSFEFYTRNTKYFGIWSWAELNKIKKTLHLIRFYEINVNTKTVNLQAKILLLFDLNEFSATTPSRIILLE